MKKINVILSLCAIIIGLCACGGNISEVEIEPYQSDMYEAADIESAIEVTMKYFRSQFPGCTLTSITYAGDESSRAHADWAERNQADEVIVLTSSFDVDSSGGDGSLSPNSTYDNWNWILVRNNGGMWRHVDHGY